MSHDPLLRHIGIVLHRTLLFFILGATQALLLWLWFWMKFEPWTLVQAGRHVANAWPLSLESVSSVVAMAALWIGCADTAVVYLMLGRWWKKRSDVVHRRGSHFVDQREEK